MQDLNHWTAGEIPSFFLTDTPWKWKEVVGPLAGIEVHTPTFPYWSTGVSKTLCAELGNQETTVVFIPVG